MSEESARLGLPLLSAGQSQKEVFHNEALERIGLLLHGSVVASGVDTPPASPLPGQCWIVGSSPTGAWAGEADAVAGWTVGGWRLVAPCTGMALWDEEAACVVRHDGSGWAAGLVDAVALRVAGLQVIGSQQPSIADPSGGATVDAAARGAIADILASLRAHGLIAT